LSFKFSRNLSSPAPYRFQVFKLFSSLRLETPHKPGLGLSYSSSYFSSFPQEGADMDIRLLMIGGLALIALTNGRGAVEGVADTQQVIQERSAARSGERALRREARYAADRGAIALDRIKAGCTPVGYANNLPDITPEEITYGITEAALVDGQGAHNGKGATLTEGSFVCNSMGDTAVVRGGVLADTVRVGPLEIAEFQSYFQQIDQGYSNINP
jgi:hypothetical protein